MDITTKYNLGDFVYPIVRSSKELIKSCETCNKVGVITLNNKSYSCPACHGVGEITTYLPESWYVGVKFAGRIGKINVELYDAKYVRQSDNVEYAYMLSSTGVGSGTVWSEDKLFLTQEDAIIECMKRNLKEDKDKS